MSSSSDIYTASTAKYGVTDHRPVSAPGFDLPSVEQVLSSLPEVSTPLPPRGRKTLDLEDQKSMFHLLKSAIENSGNSFDPKELHAPLEQADADARRGQRDPESLKAILDQLWSCDSEFLVQAAEILANESRNRESFLGQPI